MPRVISYTRFSSRRQARGDSYRRQTELAMRWCLKNGHELDTSLSLEDLGVSGFSGANVKKGALYALQKMVLDGKLEPGTILLIEAFDRLTRLPLPEANELLLSLINRGLTVVTLTDEKVWNSETLVSLEAFLLSILTLYRGFQESSFKSQRLRSTFAQARETGYQGAFGTAPGWLSREHKDAPWVVDEEKAESVRKVFKLAAAGLGSKAIAARANSEKWPVPTRLNATQGRWHGQMPGQLLRNRAVLGEHEHKLANYEELEKHYNGTTTGIVRKDFYPRIITEEDWNKARASIATRAAAKRRNTNYYNIFSSLMYCGHCGAPIHRKSEKKGYSRAQLNCSDRIAGVTKCQTMSAKACDRHLLQAIYEYAIKSLGSESSEALTENIAVLDTLIDEKQQQLARIADAIASTGGSIDAFAAKAKTLNEELDKLKRERQKKAEEKALAGGTSVFDTAFVDNAMAKLYVSDDEDAKEARATLHLKLARVVDTIWVWAYDVALISYKDQPEVIHVVALGDKILPSRANPSAKHHKPPPERKPKPKPHLALALQGLLTPPKPRRLES